MKFFKRTIRIPSLSNPYDVDFEILKFIYEINLMTITS